MGKMKRYAIHYTIIAFLLCIPFSFGVHGLNRMMNDKTFMQPTTKVIADGVVEFRDRQSDGSNWLKVNGKMHRVQYQVYVDYQEGDNVVLVGEAGQKFGDVMLFLVTMGCIIVLIICGGILGIKGIERYMKWLKEGK